MRQLRESLVRGIHVSISVGKCMARLGLLFIHDSRELLFPILFLTDVGKINGKITNT